MQEDKASGLRVMNEMSAALKGRAVQVISFTFKMGFCYEFCLNEKQRNYI